MRMTAALARYWDSFENASDSEIGPNEEPVPVVADTCHKEWLSQLSMAVEQECMSILYAKSLLNEEPQSQTVQSVQATPPPKPHRISVGINSSQLSQSLCNLSTQAPPKPQRCIVRMTSSKNNIALTAATKPRTAPETPSSSFSSASHLIELTKQSQASVQDEGSLGYSQQSLCQSEDQGLGTQSTNSFRYEKKNQWTPPGYRTPRRRTESNIKPTEPPAYDQLPIKVERSGSRVVGTRRPPLHALRHTIAVNEDDLHHPAIIMSRNGVHSAEVAAPSFPSPTSVNTTSTESMDSGQGSGEPAISCHHSISSNREEMRGYREEQLNERLVDDVPDERDEKETSESSSVSVFGAYHNTCLPGYPRMASTMDHVLRTSSAIYSLLSYPPTPSTSRDLLAKSAIFIQIIEGSPCASFIPKYDVNVVRLQLQDLEREATALNRPPTVTNYFTIVLRKMVEQVLTLFAKIISRYMCECVNKDRLLVIALEHLIHLVLFGDELSLETIHNGVVNSLLKFLRQTSTPPDCRRLLLRALAVLCGVSKGCLQLLSLGGLEVVLTELCGPDIPCSIEAAGVLTQLTNPQHSFVQLNNLGAIIQRLLDVIDLCETAESLLLCTAALANCSLQDTHSVDLFYRHNAVCRLIAAYNKHNCSTIFVQEQLVTILSRMAARHFEEALIAQGAIPVLLEMLTVTDTVHADYCRRIRYKAAVCIGTLAATGVGLKALYNNQAYAILCHVMKMENSASNPLGMICSNIRSKLENKYQVESAV